ncbi:MAG TPA: ABC transporter permease [Gemmatimonadaceae bacterium]|nr:ABC transporter permease [Gemmatimonadaceae bacterium]
MNGAFPKRAPSWRRYLRFWRRDVHADTDDEIRLHLESRVADLVAGGLPREEARTQAIEEFGDVDDVRRELRMIDRGIERRQSHRDVLGALRDDLRYTVRSLARSRGFVIMVVTTMALGLGLNAAMFTFIDEVFFRPPAGVKDPGTVRRVWMTHYRTADDKPFAATHTNYVTYQILQDATSHDAELAVYLTDDAARLGHGESAPTAVAAYTTTNYAHVLGVRVARGRWFADAENRLGAPTPVSVLSEALAQRQHVDVGSKLLVDGAVTTVIGVVGGGFRGPDLDAVGVWLPIAMDTAKAGDGIAWWQSRNGYGLSLISRVATTADESVLAQRMTAALQADQRTQKYGDTLETASFGPVNEARGPGEREATVTVATRLAVVAAIVLIIACANVINLLLARAVLRRRELSIRVALGIARTRLIRLITAETVVLALLAGGAALVAAYWGGTLLRVLLLPDTHWGESPVSWRVVAFTLGASVAAGIVVGVVPAIRASAPSMSNFLRGGDATTRHSSRLRATLVGVQSAFALALLVMSLLFVASLRNVGRVDIGYDAQRLVFAQLRFEQPPPNAKTIRDHAYRELARELTGAPGVEGIALAGFPPMRGFSVAQAFVNGDSIMRLVADHEDFPTFSAVSATYFRTVGTRLVRGRIFTDQPGANEVVIDEHMARVVWHGADPIGQCMRFQKPTNPCYTVVGVVRDAHRDHVIESDERAQYYLPIDNMPIVGWSAGTVIIRAEPAMMPPVMRDVHDRLQRIVPSGEASLKRMSEYLEPDYRPFRLGATLFTAFGVLALIVTLVGIYSTVAYGVEQRTREFSVRAALGATTRDVVRLVVGQELRAVCVGLLAGAAIVIAGGRFVASLLYGIQPTDPRVMAAVAVLLLLAAIAASLGPAWRAGRADPVNALKSE